MDNDYSGSPQTFPAMPAAREARLSTRRIMFCCLSAMALGFFAATPARAVEPTATVVEFYNTALKHYFVTASAVEAASIDAGGAGPGWVRTNGRFSAFQNPGDAEELLAVCRFYGSAAIDPATGLRRGPNSHFYTSNAAECE